MSNTWISVRLSQQTTWSCFFQSSVCSRKVPTKHVTQQCFKDATSFKTLKHWYVERIHDITSYFIRHQTFCFFLLEINIFLENIVMFASIQQMIQLQKRVQVPHLTCKQFDYCQRSLLLPTLLMKSAPAPQAEALWQIFLKVQGSSGYLLVRHKLAAMSSFCPGTEMWRTFWYHQLKW